MGGQNFVFTVGGFFNEREYSAADWLVPLMRETKHLSTDTTVGWTKNTQNPEFFEKWKKSSKTQEL